MIQIKRDNLDTLAERHYIEYFEGKGFLEKLKEIENSEKDRAQRRFFQYILTNIKDIITGAPETLSKIREELYYNHKAILKKIEYYEKLKRKKKKAEKDFKKSQESLDKLVENRATQAVQGTARDNMQKKHQVLKRIEYYVHESTQLLMKINKVFNYTDFCTIGNNWGAYELVKELNIDVCPYCNRQFISIAEPTKGEKGRTRPQLDHFYSKSKYPFLSISFFNLIPCCYVCNSNLKRNYDFTRETHLHPYEAGFENLIQFTIEFEKNKGKLDYVKAWYSNPELFSIGLKLNPIKKNQYTRDELKVLLRKVNNNKRVFKLKSLYNSHRDYVGEILVKSMMYNDSKIDALQHEFPRLFPTKESVVRLLHSNYIDSSDWDKRVLSKLTYDVTQEFGIHNA